MAQTNIRHECFWGESGSGKTTAILELIYDYLTKNPTKKVRVYVGDGSKPPYYDTGLVESGHIQLCDYSLHNRPISTMQDICSGKFPENPEDPNSKFLDLTPEDFQTIGFWVFEGLSTASQYLMGSRKGGLAEQAARGIKIGKDSPFQIVEQDTDENGRYKKGTGTGRVYGGNPMSHYNFAQRQVLTWLEATKTLPGWVIWTAHERVGEDTAGERLVAPEAAGKALSAGLSKYFGNTLHFTTALGTKKQQDATTQKNVNQSSVDYRLYTRDHFDPDGITPLRYRAVNRCPIPGEMPDYISGERNVIKFYDILIAAAKKRFQLPTTPTPTTTQEL